MKLREGTPRIARFEPGLGYPKQNDCMCFVVFLYLDEIVVTEDTTAAGIMLKPDRDTKLACDCPKMHHAALKPDGTKSART